MLQDLKNTRQTEECTSLQVILFKRPSYLRRLLTTSRLAEVPAVLWEVVRINLLYSLTNRKLASPVLNMAAELCVLNIKWTPFSSSLNVRIYSLQQSHLIENCTRSVQRHHVRICVSTWVVKPRRPHVSCGWWTQVQWELSVWQEEEP